MGASEEGRIYVLCTCTRPLGIFLTFPAPGRIDAAAFACCGKAGTEKSLLRAGGGGGAEASREMSDEGPVPQAWHLNED